MVERERFAEAMGAARGAVDRGAEMIEWRFDVVADEVSSCLALIADSPVPCIVTCRPTWEGGEYEGNEEARMAFLREVIVAGEAKYVDIEFAVNDVAGEEIRRLVKANERDRATGLIVSAHDFSGRPVDLYRRVSLMMEDESVAVVKVAWQGKSLRDNLQVFEILEKRQKPTIALCMGRFGLMSRILAKKFGGFVTFANAEEGRVTAAGQPSVDDLRNRYRFDAIGRETGVYGLMGWPVEHSLGMDLHNAGFSRVGFDGVYVPMPIPPEYEHFKATLSAFLDDEYLDFRGASVTLPHKGHLVRFASEWEGAVEVGDWVAVSGSANTIAVDENKILKIANTDIDGLLDSLCFEMGIGRERLAGMRVAVIGAGGVARSVVAGLSAYGAEIGVFNRTEERARALVRLIDERLKEVGGASQVKAYEIGAFGGESYDILINATSVGMRGGRHENRSPVSVEAMERGVIGGGLVFDVVYTPMVTPLLRHSMQLGFRTLGGLDMLVRQAVRQFALWTGVEPDIEEWTTAAHGRIR